MDINSSKSNSPDPNNNVSPSMKGYSLRPRTSRRCEEVEAPVELPQASSWRPSRTKRKQRSMPLSKYRRKTANARERSRMREINEAFETLRRVIPHVTPRDCSGDKLTKISTLRLAMKYISALDNLLNDQEFESDADSLFSDYTLTPPDLSLSEPSLPPDLFGTLELPADPIAFDSPMGGSLLLPETSLEPPDPCVSATDQYSSYEFDETQFLSHFS